jgi:hypothetical protein
MALKSALRSMLYQTEKLTQQFHILIGQIEKKTNILWLTVLFIIVFLLYVLCPVTTSTDSRWTFYISMSMLREKNTNLDEYAHLMENRDFRVIYLDGHIYSYFPLGVSLVSVPYVWVVDQAFNLRYPTDLKTYLANHFPDNRLAKIEKVAASFISAVAAVLFFMLISLQLDRLRSALLTFIFAFLTPMLSTASRALWQHGLSVLCLTLVLWVLFQRNQGKRWLFLTGVMLGFSYVVRPTNSLSVVFLTLYILFNRRKDILSYFAGLLTPLFIFVFHGFQTYHSILPPYYMPQRLGTNSYPYFFNAFWGSLISPNRGLFTTTPIFLFSIFGIYLLTRKHRLGLENIELYMAAILLAHWIIVSSFNNWYGGWSLGPRFFTDMTPYLVYFLIPVFEKSRLWSLFWWKVVFGIAVILSGLVHFRYATSIYPMMWNAKPVTIIQSPKRVWDILDLQVFRGTCRDKVEGRAPLCWFYPGEPKE